MGDRVADLPDPPLHIIVVGRRGQGKTELAYTLWESWPGDRCMIDMTGDVGEDHPDPHTHDLPTPPPARWPLELQEADEDRLSLRYVPDWADPDYLDDIDRVVGMCFSRGDCLLWIDDAGDAVPAHRVKPHTRRALHMARHKTLTLILSLPRPKTIDPAALAQADVAYGFDLPNPDDRQRFADVAGWDAKDVDAAFAELPDHGYLRYHARAHELAIFPPLPLRRMTRRRRHIEAHMDSDDYTRTGTAQ